MEPIDFPQLLQAGAINAISGLVSNIFWILLFIFITKYIGKKIIWAVNEIGKNVPKWLENYKSIISNQNSINHAQDSFKRNKG